MMHPALRFVHGTSLVMCLVALGGAAAAAQSPSRVPATAPPWLAPQSNLDIVLATPDAFLVKDLYRVGDNGTGVPGLTVDALVVTPKSPAGAPMRGVRIQLDSGKSSVSYVDMDEAVALSQALAEMADVASTWSVRDGARAVEAQFMTVDGFLVSFHQDGQNQRAFLRSGFTDPVQLAFTVSYLSTVKAVIDQALAVLQSK